MNAVQAKRIIKQFLLRVAPEAAGAWQDKRHRQHIRRFEQRMGLPELTDTYVSEHGLRVQSGPFVGMTYVSQAVGSALMPKLVGSYESELHSLMEQILTIPYPVVVDVGCAEGYYANGLALRLPTAQVYAFDTDPEARQLCETMAKLNGVQERVHVAGKCEPGNLNALLHDQSLIICDCEGFETELLRPDLVPAMAQADILVELHDHVKPGITPLLVSRFGATHQITLIKAVERDPADYPLLRFSDGERRRLAVSEFRPLGQQWAFLRPCSTNVLAL